LFTGCTSQHLRKEIATMLVVLIALPLTALLVAVLSQLGGNGVLGRNGFIGLRIPSTMFSDEGWRAGHHAAARPAWIGFVATTLAAIVGLVFIRTDSGSIVISIIVGAIFLATLIWVVVVANMAARSAEVLD
jgi:hypothetical protein